MGGGKNWLRIFSDGAVGRAAYNLHPKNHENVYELSFSVCVVYEIHSSCWRFLKIETVALHILSQTIGVFLPCFRMNYCATSAEMQKKLEELAKMKPEEIVEHEKKVWTRTAPADLYYVRDEKWVSTSVLWPYYFPVNNVWLSIGYLSFLSWSLVSVVSVVASLLSGLSAVQFQLGERDFSLLQNV